MTENLHSLIAEKLEGLGLRPPWRSRSRSTLTLTR